MLLAAALLLPVGAAGATRPQYGGTLRVEVRQNAETPDPPALLGDGFTIARWEAGRLAVYEADENANGGRPFLAGVEIHLGRVLRDQASDLDLGKADVVELGPNELRRQPAVRRVWSTSPVRVLALVFAPRFEDVRVREALSLAVDRSAIHTVLLQRQGEISGALLPQWLSGYAFLFPAAADLGRARQLASGAPPITLGVSGAAARPIAERIALNARDAGLAVSVTLQTANADVVLMELRIASAEPAKALAEIAAALGLPAPARGLPPPARGLPPPAVGLPAPAVGLPAPARGLPPPAVGLLAPARGLPAPAVGLPAPAVGLPAPAVGLPAPARGLPAAAREPSANPSPEHTYAAERALLEGFRVIPLLHLPDVYGVNPRVKGGPGIAPSGEWRFENLWLEGARP